MSVKEEVGSLENDNNSEDFKGDVNSKDQKSPGVKYFPLSNLKDTFLHISNSSISFVPTEYFESKSEESEEIENAEG